MGSRCWIGSLGGRPIARAILALILLVSGPVSLRAQDAGAASEESTRANAYFQQNNMQAALPLYEHLAAQAPGVAVYAERLAACLISAYQNLPVGEERNALIARARAEAERAKSLGDNSNLLQVILDSLGDAAASEKSHATALDAAEKAFSRGDMDAAIAAYQAVAAADPRAYEARVYAGDAYYRKHDVKLAGEWFQKAIDVDPDRETAYRYWGDALAAAGDNGAALQRFIDAVVAEPYQRKSWMGLSQWAKANGATLAPPHVPVPQAPSVEDRGAAKPGVTIHVDPGKDPKVSAVWLAYSSNRALWRTEYFAKHFPGEKDYRHSLPEETESLGLAVLLVAEDKLPDERLDPDLRDLMRLSKDGMLEPYVLISAADAGIAQDYAGYRAGHREQLRAYLDRYVIQRAAPRAAEKDPSSHAVEPK